MDFSVKDILQMEVAPALGCTEPVAIALGAAAARSLMAGDAIESVTVWVDPNIYKNGYAVSIPGTGGLCGMEMAAALGAVGGDPTLRLQVLNPIESSHVREARALVNAGKVKVSLLPEMRTLYIRTLIRSTRHSAEAIIETLHDNIVSLVLDGEQIEHHPILSGERADGYSADRLQELESWLKKRSLAQLLEMIDELDDQDLTFIKEGIQFNQALADYGLKNGSGLGVGKTLERLIRQRLVTNDMMTAARTLTSAAADARMDGVKLPAMSSAGSGNHGLTAILPIIAVKDFITIDEKTLLEAVALSHIVTGYIKAYTGRLSAVCGCSVAAGAGATAGITYLLGGDVRHISGAIKNLIMDLAGVICDGAKAGCALKLSTAAGTAVQAALFALQGVTVQATDGIISASPEGTMKNVGTLTTEGMIETDRTILKIMLDKHFSED
jgi:L-cysteine desulfidase